MNASDNKPRVLLAEDTAVGRKVVAQILTEAGYQVTAVADGQAVLDLLSGSSFDLVVMDCMMPEMDGFEACRKIRAGVAGAENASIPVVAITGLASDADRQKCLDAGMDDYVQKPVTWDSLVGKLEQLVSSRKTDAEAAARLAHEEQEQNLLQSLDEWSPGFLDHIIDQFLEDVPADIAALREALDSEDMALLRSLAHRLRGSADVLSAGTLSKRARALERASAEANLALVRQLGPALILELENMLESYS